MLLGVRPIMLLASNPTATTFSVLVSTATTEGSEQTIPHPLTNTRVLAVPRSIATSGATHTPVIPILLSWPPPLAARPRRSPSTPSLVILLISKSAVHLPSDHHTNGIRPERPLILPAKGPSSSPI